jgi:hypothetical protein
VPLNAFTRLSRSWSLWALQRGCAVSRWRAPSRTQSSVFRLAIRVRMAYLLVRYPFWTVREKWLGGVNAPWGMRILCDRVIDRGGRLIVLMPLVALRFTEHRALRA